RTIQRVFLEETKMNFGKWRQQLRLLHGLQLLASGEKRVYIDVPEAAGNHADAVFGGRKRTEGLDIVGWMKFTEMGYTPERGIRNVLEDYHQQSSGSQRGTCFSRNPRSVYVPN